MRRRGPGRPAGQALRDCGIPVQFDDAVRAHRVGWAAMAKSALRALSGLSCAWLARVVIAWAGIAVAVPVNAATGPSVPASGPAPPGLSIDAPTGHIDVQPAPPGRLPWVVFDERSGLPQHAIVDLLADRNGFV